MLLGPAWPCMALHAPHGPTRNAQIRADLEGEDGESSLPWSSPQTAAGCAAVCDGRAGCTGFEFVQGDVHAGGGSHR